MAVRKIAHPSIDERKAKGLDARDQASPSSHTKWAPAGPPRPGRPAAGAGRHPRAGPGAGPSWPDDGLAVHLLPGRGQDHGGGPEGHAGGRPRRPAVRRRPPVELRPVRLARADPAVRPERLRRDPAGAVRVRREADGGELYHRRPQQRILQGGHARGDARVGDGLPGGDGRVRADADDGHLVRAPGRGRAHGRDQQRRGRGGEAGEDGEEAGEGGQAGEGAEEGEETGGETGEGGRDEKAAETAKKRAEKTRRRRHTHATACRRCPSSASRSMAATGSSASRRSSSRRATWPPRTVCPRTRSCR